MSSRDVCGAYISGSCGARSGRSCAGLGIQGLGDSDVEQIKQVITGWTDAFVAGSLSEWDSFWVTDAVLVPPGQTRTNGEGKLNAFGSTPFFDDVASASFTEGDVVNCDDLAVVTNDVSLMSHDPSVEHDQAGDRPAPQRNRLLADPSGDVQHPWPNARGLLWLGLALADVRGLGRDPRQAPLAGLHREAGNVGHLVGHPDAGDGHGERVGRRGRGKEPGQFL